jgi:thymidylate synthase|nr:MAG TPA: hypothetical protein [Caudoviricetes sp.]
MYYNQFFEAENADEAFEYWWHKLSNYMPNDVLESRDGNVVDEIINAVTVIKDPTRCIMKNKIRKMPMRYAVGELLWYLSGSNDLKSIRMFTNAWDRMSDDGETANSNYGYCLMDKFGFNQIEQALTQLRDNPQSRQVVLHIKEARNLIDDPTKDLNCTVCLQLFIRDGKLYMTTYMRSNDLWMGFPYDVFQFTCLQILLAMKLHVDVGTYTHIAGSLHLYERDYEKGIKNLREANLEKVEG